MAQQVSDFEFWSTPSFGRDRREFQVGLLIEARLFRNYSSLPDALKAIQVLTPRKSPSGKGHRILLASLVDALLQSLGTWPYDYDAARRTLSRWTEAARRTSDHPELRQFAKEANILIPRLIGLYDDPRKFFNEVAPGVYGFDFTDALSAEVLRARLLLSHSQEPPPSAVMAAETLGRILRTWGCAALFNRNVRRAFDAAPADVVLEALAIAEGRTTYRRGPPIGKTKGKPKKRRVDHAQRKAVYWAAANLLEGRDTAADREILDRKNLLTVLLAAVKKNEGPFKGPVANQMALRVTAQFFKRSPSTIEKSVTRARKK